MNLDELRNEIKTPAAVAGQVAFLPWLQLKTPVQIAGVTFVPYTDDGADVSAVFKDAATSLTMIFSSYVDRDGKAVKSPVIATMLGKWNLADGDVETVAWAARLLFLSCFAGNEYFVDGGGRYVNSVLFRPVFQRFSGGPWIGLTSRRRYGSSMNGGYQHGEIKFNLPVQCTIEKATVDEPLLKALDAAHASGTSKAMGLFSTALPYVELANTDDDLMSEAPEAILMGSAFEQLLEGNASAYTLATNFGDLFKAFGTVTVAEALKVKPAIRIDPDPHRAAAQKVWWVHKKWIEELYGLRNESAHEGTTNRKKRAWSAFEHLVISAFVFPLIVKILLEREGFYALAPEDGAHSQAVDKLLTADGWNRLPTDGASRWIKIVAKEVQDARFKKAFAKVLSAWPSEPKTE